MKKGRFKKEQIMVYFIAFIMISSVFGVIFYGYSGQDAEVSYEEFVFSREDETNKWSTTIDGIEFYFDYFPTEVQQTNITDDIITRLSETAEIDVTYDPNSSKKEIFAYIGYDMQQQLALRNIFVRSGFSRESEYDVPIITCEDATDLVPVLYFKESEVTGFVTQGNCIIIKARGDYDFVRIKDRLLYGILDVMK